jgi:iron complex outermembrane recepter protein
MNTKILLVLSFILICTSVFATEPESPQRLATDANIFGHVLDAETGEHLAFVNLMIKGTRIGTMTDATGHYLLTNLPVGRHTLIVQSMGFETAQVEFEIKEKQTLK